MVIMLLLLLLWRVSIRRRHGASVASSTALTDHTTIVAAISGAVVACCCGCCWRGPSQELQQRFTKNFPDEIDSYWARQYLQGVLKNASLISHSPLIDSLTSPCTMIDHLMKIKMAEPRICIRRIILPQIL